MLELIMSWLNEALGKVFFMLPDSPFPAFLQFIDDITWLKYLNWFIPLDIFFEIGTLWLTAVGGYYAWSLVLRWIKAVE